MAEDDTAIQAVAATASWSSVQYGTRREFSGRVTMTGAYTRGASDEGQVDQIVINIHSFPSDRYVVEEED